MVSRYTGYFGNTDLFRFSIFICENLRNLRPYFFRSEDRTWLTSLPIVASVLRRSM